MLEGSVPADGETRTNGAAMKLVSGEGRRAGKRNVVVDALRGTCFVFMTVDHFPGNPLIRFSNPYFGLFGFFTVALGFVFISGLVAGFVYDAYRTRHGMPAMIRRITRRAFALYVTQIVMISILLVAVTVNLRGVGRWHLELLGADPWKGLSLGASLLYEPDYLAILPMYVFFLLLTPLVLWQFGRGHLWPVLGVSAIVWTISGLVVRLPEDLGGVDFGAFNPLGYQFLFVVGLAFGSNQFNLERLPRSSRRWLFGVALATVIVFFFLRQEYAFHGPLNPVVHPVDNLFSTIELGPLRLLDFAAFALVLYWLLRRFHRQVVDTGAFQWLAFIGRHSLPVFAWSILVTYAALAMLPLHPGLAWGIAGVVLATASLTIPAEVHALVLRRRKTGLVSEISAAPALTGAGPRS